MSLNRRLSNDLHVRRFVVTSGAGGWDVLEKQDEIVLRHVRREDWHRVERDIQRFETTARELKRSGWIEH
jgi:hypothetical protein